MASLNQVFLIGNLTRDPQVKYTTSGTAVCEIGLAVNNKYKDKAGKTVEDVSFIDVTLWGRTAEIAGEYLAKGRPVLIQGRLKLETWDDRETGQKRSKIKVIGESLQMLGQKPGGNGEHSRTRVSESGESDQSRDYGGSDDFSSTPDDVPF